MNWLFAVVGLTISAWGGTDYATADIASVRYRLVVSGKPGAAFHLRAEGIARGWIAAFCTPKLCSPRQVDAVLPASGRSLFAFELFRESRTAATSSGAVIRSVDGATAIVPTR